MNRLLFTSFSALMVWGSVACRGPEFMLGNGGSGAGDDTGGGDSGGSGAGNVGGSGGAGDGGSGGGTPQPTSCEPVEGEAVGAECGVFVEPGATGGDGTRESPFGSFAEAIAEGASNIYLCEGNVPAPNAAESDATYLVGSGAIRGGYACGSWAFQADGRTVLEGDPDVAITVLALGDLLLEGLTIKGPEARQPSGFSIALGAFEANLSLVRTDLIAGAGENGEDGAKGQNAIAANDGGNATTNAIGGAGATSTCGSGGGNGAGQGASSGQEGQPDQNNGGANGTGSCLSTGPGGPGVPGGVGSDGPDGSWNNTMGYDPAEGDALDGGRGGGGGGGGYFMSHPGGGGGAGGCGGKGGKGGGGGGWSIALYLVAGTVTFDDVHAESAEAGNGGSGGEPGTGVLGGGGGNGFDTGACVGGSGGKGGDGGKGGGGPGGNSVVVVYVGSPPNLDGLDAVNPDSSLAGEGGAVDESADNDGVAVVSLAVASF